MQLDLTTDLGAFRIVQKVLICGSIFFLLAVYNFGLLTTKFLLVQGYNYPLHLLRVHLTTAALFETVELLVVTLVHGFSGAADQLAKLACPKPSGLAILALLVYSVTASGALIFVYQAIQHFGTFSVLAITLICTTHSWNLYYHAFTYTKRCIALILILICVIAATCLIDAKIDPHGVGALAAAAGLLKLAQAVDSWTTVRWINQDPAARSIQRAGWNLSALAIAIALTSLSVWKWENPMFSPLTWGSVNWLTFSNIGVSALMLKLGLSPFSMLRIQIAGGEHGLERQEFRGWSDILLLSAWFALVTSTAASCVFHIPWSMNNWQYICCFLMMEVALAVHQESRSTSGDNQGRVSMAPGLPHSYTLAATSNDEKSGGISASAVSLKSIYSALFTKSDRISILSRAILMAVLCTWMNYNTVESPSAKAAASLNRPGNMHNTLRSLDFVVAHFDEAASDLAWQLNSLLELPTLHRLHPRVVVYNKGDVNSGTALQRNLTRMLKGSSEVLVVNRPNVGREAETYLNHILSSWDSLATHTFFMQSSMHYFMASKQRISQYFVAETGFLPLSPLETCNGCESCSDHSTWSEDSRMLERIYRDANGGKECEGLLLTYRGQFIASSSRIRAQGEKHFSDLINELRDVNSYTHSYAYADRPWLPGKEDKMSAPLFGYTMERLWAVIMQCSEPRIATDCPSLSSGLVRSFAFWKTANIGDCQCLDSY